MQTISSMQRNSRDKYALKNLVFWVFLFFYEILTSIYTSLPPFIGLFFAYAVILKYEKDKNYLFVDAYNMINFWPDLVKLKDINLEDSRICFIDKMIEFSHFTKDFFHLGYLLVVSIFLIF